MPLPHRIAAGAIILNQEKILLVRYADAEGGSYLVAPGGKVEENEGLAEAAVRETHEETGVIVAVMRLLTIEELMCSRYLMCKVWFLGAYVSGEARMTQGSAKEGITQVGWFSRHELAREVLYPTILHLNDWASFSSPNWTANSMGLRRANF